MNEDAQVVFQEAMQDKSFVEALMDANTGEECVKILGTKGFTIPLEEADAFLDEFNSLGEDEIEGVAGGVGNGNSVTYNDTTNVEINNTYYYNFSRNYNLQFNYNNVTVNN